MIVRCHDKIARQRTTDFGDALKLGTWEPFRDVLQDREDIH